MPKTALNKNLHQAKNAKKDEFYTQLSDIENELKHYKAHFKIRSCIAIVMIPEWVISFIISLTILKI